MKRFRENGFTACTHGNTHRRLQRSLSFESTEFVDRFTLSYAEENALLLPGQIPGHSYPDIKLLPYGVSKRGIWKMYHGAAEESGDVHAVAYTTFCRIWRSLLPSIIMMTEGAEQSFVPPTAQKIASPGPSGRLRSTSALSR